MDRRAKKGVDDMSDKSRDFGEEVLVVECSDRKPDED